MYLLTNVITMLMIPLLDDYGYTCTCGSKLHVSVHELQLNDKFKQE